MQNSVFLKKNDDRINGIAGIIIYIHETIELTPISTHLSAISRRTRMKINNFFLIRPIMYTTFFTYPHQQLSKLNIIKTLLNS